MTTYALVNGVVGSELTPSAPVSPAVPEYIGTETKATLVAEARRRGLSIAGTKSEIVARLRAHAADELVDALDGGGDVGSVSLGDEGVADGEQLGDGEAAGALDADPDAGHED